METLLTEIVGYANGTLLLVILGIYFKVWLPAQKAQDEKDKKQDELVTDLRYRVKALEEK